MRNDVTHTGHVRSGNDGQIRSEFDSVLPNFYHNGAIRRMHHDVQHSGRPWRGNEYDLGTILQTSAYERTMFDRNLAGFDQIQGGVNQTWAGFDQVRAALNQMLDGIGYS